MTTKRFVGRYAGRTIKRLIGIEDIETNRVCVTIEENIRLLNELNDENEQLKQELKDYHNAFDCSQCRYQNYDWFDDGDEFEVCDKGNNELQMNNHSCRDWEEL